MIRSYTPVIPLNQALLIHVATVANKKALLMTLKDPALLYIDPCLHAYLQPGLINL